MSSTPVTQSIAKASAGATDETLVADAHPTNKVIKWTRIVARDVDNQATCITLFFRAGASDYILKTESPSGANTTVEMKEPLFVPGNWQIGATFTGSSSGDKLEIYAYGYIVPSYPVS